ncbi:MAG: acireductone synthase [Alphaproteobacteria bacterium]|nr:acireductone synthase [Alphaproteobacteria bacterium]
MRARVVLLDIEGTTSSIAFVKEEMFPYARARIGDFVRQNLHLSAVRLELGAVGEALRREGGPAVASLDACVEALERWIDEDRKHTALKALQGMIWQKGFEEGRLKAHFYEEVPGVLRAWVEAGLTLAVYSSGSVQAQQLFYRHSVYGDLSPLISAWFDTRTGPKQEARSYVTIAHRLEVAPGELLFLSDVGAELDAAAAAGLQALQVLRPGNTPAPRHAGAETLAEVRVSRSR